MEDLGKWINSIDSEALFAAMADDVVIEQVGGGIRIEGKDAVAALFAGYASQTQEERIEIIRWCVDGSTIWNERVDHYLIDGRWHKIPIMGFLELNDDQQVILMRDYYDPGLALRPAEHPGIHITRR